MPDTNRKPSFDCPVCGNLMTKIPGPDRNIRSSHGRPWRCQYCRQPLTANFRFRPGGKRPKFTGFEIPNT